MLVDSTIAMAKAADTAPSRPSVSWLQRDEGRAKKKKNKSAGDEAKFSQTKHI